MILPDVNVLVYSFRESAPDHVTYARWLRTALDGDEDLLLSDLVLSGFLRIVTDSRIVDPVTPPGLAMSFVQALLSAPRSRMAHSTTAVWRRLGQLTATDSQLRGKLIPDAHLAALALSHDARVATRDRGFGRYPNLAWFDPAQTA